MKTFINNLLKDIIPEQQFVHYHVLRQTVGWLGILLPFALYAGSVWFSNCNGTQSSISHYYFTNMREVFVGVLWVFGIFLFTYKGYSKLDNFLTHFAGLCCLLVSIFPTFYDVAVPCQAEPAMIFNVPYHTTIHFTRYFNAKTAAVSRIIIMRIR